MLESFGTMLVCDDIRYEQNGKVSYMGIYEQGMLFANPAPATVSQLCIASNVWISAANKIDNLVIRIQLEDSDLNVTELASKDIELNHEPPEGNDVEDPGYFIYINHFILRDIDFFGASRLMLRVYSGDDVLRCGTVLVSFPDPEVTDPDMEEPN